VGDGPPGSDGPAECRGFADEGGWSMVIQIRNRTPAPIHLGSRQSACGNSPPFSVATPDGQGLQTSGQCVFSCSALMSGAQRGCPLICLTPSSISLMPGESLRAPCGGTYLSAATLPQACLPEDVLLDQCTQQKRIEPGELAFAATAGTELDCSMTGGVPCGPCRPNPDGACTTSSSLIAGDELRAENTVKLDAGYGVGEGKPRGEPLGSLRAGLRDR
jgi:hypothetical protein